MTINLLTISAIVGCVFSLIIVLCVILAAKRLKKILFYIRDWRMSENKDKVSWTCTKCGGWNNATQFFCEDCGKLGNPNSLRKT